MKADVHAILFQSDFQTKMIALDAFLCVGYYNSGRCTCAEGK